MKTPLTALVIIGRKLLSSVKNKTGKSTIPLSIERKWWMGEDLFLDQKPFTGHPLKNKRITG